MEVVGVYREAMFSPGRTGDDALILEAVAAEVGRRGVRVRLWSTEELQSDAKPPGLVFSMAQGGANLHKLQHWQAHGSLVINSPTAVWNCRRARTVELCRAAGVLMPESWAVNTADASHALSFLPFVGATCQRRPRDGQAREPGPTDFSGGFWLKRADVHATQPDDVVFVQEAAAYHAALAAFARRGIVQALLQRHCPGPVIKFYGVGPGCFFDCPEVEAHTRRQVGALATRAASAVGLEVFGGDCILSAEGTLVLIDLNDWPSFARCRHAAAQAIADHLLGRIQQAL
ncbi:MAG TPA: hypothetical protein VNN62_20780 [Methylomirabilota bacterium]|jgi:hypothetical protein|nr:hypothetical protein [Methylomirabilota bacterium]